MNTPHKKLMVGQEFKWFINSRRTAPAELMTKR